MYELGEGGKTKNCYRNKQTRNNTPIWKNDHSVEQPLGLTFHLFVVVVVSTQ